MTPAPAPPEGPRPTLARIQAWWQKVVDTHALPITKAEWDELDAAIRADERAKSASPRVAPATAEEEDRWMAWVAVNRKHFEERFPNAAGVAPAAPERERTHWEGCWRQDGHHDCALAEIHRLMFEIGTALPGTHPDEQKPRADSWHQERRNWIAEVERLRAALVSGDAGRLTNAANAVLQGLLAKGYTPERIVEILSRTQND